MHEMEFAERLKCFRKANNLTQQELADLLGVSNKSVSRWESGVGYPDIALLVPLARALGVTVDALLCDDPPIRTLGAAEWQNLLSFAFAIGGGVLFFLLDLFMPTLICYFLYLGAMAYGVYLQNLYTYHSRWFRLANLTMNFFVNFAICGLIASAVEVLFIHQYLSLFSDGDISLSTLISQIMSSGNSLSGSTLLIIANIGLRILAAALLTALTGWIIHVISTSRRPRLSLNGRFSSWDVLPCSIALLPLLFWAVYRIALLPEWLYWYQSLVYVLLTVMSCLVCCLILVRKERRAIAPSLILLLILSPALWLLADRSCSWSVTSGQILATDTASPIYVPFGQFTWSMVPWTAGLILLYLLLRRIRINLSNITSL